MLLKELFDGEEVIEPKRDEERSDDGDTKYNFDTPSGKKGCIEFAYESMKKDDALFFIETYLDATLGKEEMAQYFDSNETDEFEEEPDYAVADNTPKKEFREIFQSMAEKIVELNDPVDVKFTVDGQANIPDDDEEMAVFRTIVDQLRVEFSERLPSVITFSGDEEGDEELYVMIADMLDDDYAPLNNDGFLILFSDDFIDIVNKGIDVIDARVNLG